MEAAPLFLKKGESDGKTNRQLDHTLSANRRWSGSSQGAGSVLADCGNSSARGGN